MMHMKNMIVLALLLALSGCSKRDSFGLKKMEYEQECRGDLSVRCRSMLVDLNVAKLEAAIEAVESKQSNIVACHGQKFFDDGIAVIEDRITYFRDLKPNIFMRTFLSGMDVEFDPSGHRREADFEAFLVASGKCVDAPAAKSQVPSTAAVAASITSASDALDSNADDRPTSLTTVAGELARKEIADGQFALMLNGAPLFKGDDANWQFPLRSFKISGGREAILVASSGGRGNSCETLFFFLLADQSGVKPTPVFGTCSPQGKIRQSGDLVMLMLPKMGGNTLFVLDGATVSEDGKPIALDATNNPAN